MTFFMMQPITVTIIVFKYEPWKQNLTIIKKAWFGFCVDFAFILAMDLAKDQKFNFGDEIANGIRVAKKQVRF